ncbi:zinc finger, C2H2 type, partial [Cooperia oncophora]
MSRVHSKEKEDKKPLECSICGKNFPRLSHLQRHQLIHIKEREWGCPFCEQSFVQKPHLMRHIGRCHASQYRDGLQEKVAANKWRTEAKPIDVEVPKKFDTNTPSVQQCSDLIPRMLCVRCGSTFDNRTDLDRHVTNTHRSLKCKHCGEIFDGYASLRSHELRQRAHSYVCSCGASFSRQSELRAHRDSCRKRGSFLCVACERLFTQRV